MTRSVPLRRVGFGLALGGLGFAVVGLFLAALYGSGLLSGNSDCGPALARLAPLARGEVAAFEVAARPGPAPPISFDGPDGGRLTLADFRGRTVLLNLWATWCEPCKREMPALDALQAELGGPRFEVAAVNIDTRNPERARTWLAGAGVTRLAFYSDRDAKVFQDLRRVGQAQGMPTTILIDAAGCRLGTMAGGAEWSSPDGLALVRAAIGG